MKTKQNKTKHLALLVIIFVSFFHFQSEAQVQLINNHPSGCPVTISIEASNTCGSLCFTGVLTINVGSPVTLPAGCGLAELCVNVLSVGGVPVISNHISRGICHIGPVQFFSGANPSGCNGASTMWTSSLLSMAPNWVLY